jgi:hypothetical protein
VNGELINNKKSTVIELGTCIVNVLCQLEVKCYTVKALISECNLAVELKTTLCLYEPCLHFDVNNSLLKLVQAL